MSELLDRIKEFLDAGGFAVRDVETDFVLANKHDKDEHLAIALWAVDNQAGVTPEKQKAFISFWKDTKAKHHNLEARIVRRKGISLSGIRKALEKEAAQGQISIQSVIKFFDTAYVQEKSSAFGQGAKAFARIARDEIIALAKQARRVDQPFFAWRTLYDFAPLRVDGADLLAHLKEDLRELGPRPAIRFIIGPAGMGKSILYNQLFRDLYDEFNDDKRSDVEGIRPISFLPRWVWEERRAGVAIERMAELVEAIGSTHGLKPTEERRMASWLLKSGHTLWMMDGLDEFFAGATDFEPFLRELVAPPSQAKLLIFMRDAVFSTGAKNFIHFFSDYKDTGNAGLVRIYQLAPWGMKECRDLAWLRLEDRLPGLGEKNTPTVQDFVEKGITAELDELLQVPYYCDVLLDRYKKNPASFARSEFALIEEFFQELLAREEQKLIPADVAYKDWRLLQGKTHLETLLQFIAYNFCIQRDRALERDRPYQGTNLEELDSYIYEEDFEPGATDQQRKHARLSLFQMPLFSSSSDGGYIEFAQELMAEYLAGKFVLRSAGKDIEKFCEYVGRYFFDESSLFCRFLSFELRKNQAMVNQLRELIRLDIMKYWYRRNIIQLLLNAAEDRAILRKDAAVLQERNLYGVRFSELDLAGTSFRDADLTKCTFEKCTLAHADFDGARLAGTRFDSFSANSLSGASLTRVKQFSQVYIGEKQISNLTDFIVSARGT